MFLVNNKHSFGKHLFWILVVDIFCFIYAVLFSREIFLNEFGTFNFWVRETDFDLNTKGEF